MIDPLKTAGQFAETTIETGEFDVFAWKSFLPLAFGGHCYYVRQDATGDRVGPSHQRQIDGIVLPDSFADRSICVTVLGIGPKVGTKADRNHRLEYEWPGPFAFVSGVKVGDRLLLGFEKGNYGDVLTPKIKRSPLNWNFECFVEETLPDAIVEDD